MPRPDGNVLVGFFDNYAQTGHNACPLQCCGLVPWPRWTVHTTAVIVAPRPCGCSCRQQPHNHFLADRHARHHHIEGKLGSVATPLRPEERRPAASKQVATFTAGTEQAINNAKYDQGRAILRTRQSPCRQQLPRSHRPPTALLSRRRCYGRHIAMQIAGFRILCQSRTTANMESSF